MSDKPESKKPSSNRQKPKGLWSKRLWRHYLRSAERMLKLFRIINITFVVGSTLVVLTIISLFTPLFSRGTLFILSHLPLPSVPSDYKKREPSAYVVLGGGLTNDINNHVILNKYSLNRIRTVAGAYHNKPLPIILSGAEAPWMNQWLVEHGISEQLSENASMNTCENARFTAKRTPLRHVYLITDSYHMTRSRRQFALNGVYSTPINASLPVRRDWMKPAQNLSHSRRAVYETAAYLRDLLRPQMDCRRAEDISKQQLLTPRGDVKQPSE